MSDEDFWKKIQNYIDEVKEAVRDEQKESRKELKKIKTDQSLHIKKTNEIIDRLPEQPTWDRLNENESFRELPEKSQKVIWELAKIEEGDSPKTQSEVADHYGIDRSRVSQMKKKMDELDI